MVFQPKQITEEKSALGEGVIIIMAGSSDCQDHLSETVSGREILDHVPNHGYRVKLDHKFSKKGEPFKTPRLHQLPSFIGLSLRLDIYIYIIYVQTDMIHASTLSITVLRPQTQGM